MNQLIYILQTFTWTFDMFILYGLLEYWVEVRTLYLFKSICDLLDVIIEAHYASIAILLRIPLCPFFKARIKKSVKF